jgi:small-conductance mechanosensitive channel
VAPPAQAAPGLTPTPQPIAVSDIPAQAEAVEAFARTIAANFPTGPELADLDQRITVGEAELKKLLTLPAATAPEEVQLVELQEIDGEVRDMDAGASKIESALVVRARALDTDLDRLQELQRRWAATVPAAAEAGAPEAVQRRAIDTVAAIDALQMEAKKRRNEALTQLDRVSRVRSALDTVRAQTAERRRNAQRRLFALSEGPIWRTAWTGRPIGRAALQQIERDLRRFERYVRQSGVHLAAWFVAFFLSFLALLLILRGPARECAKTDPFARGPIRMIERPLAAALLSALLLLVWTFPISMEETLYREIVWVLLILSTAVLLRKLLGRAVARTLYVLTAAACVSLLRYLYEQDPLLDRVVLILQATAVGATLAVDLAKGSWNQALGQKRWQRIVTGVMIAAVALLAVALVLVVVGYVGPARLLRNGVIGSLGVGLISIGAYSLVYGLASTLLSTRPARALHLVQNKSDRIRLFLRRVFAAFFFLEWVHWSMRILNLADPAGRLLGAFLEATFRVGSATVSVSAILTFLLVLAGTFLLAGFLSFVLEGEILPRLKLRRGVAFTVSTTVRYAIVVGGGLLAFSASGVDLSRVSLLAGALGVGLGFGLQNLVSNFISGLILLFERPIQVGDVVDVGALVGEVKRIGMRSSTIRTAEGAEVVVPNADLISKSVINWTLSDRRRRIEIKVGVAYGTDPEKVIGLLLQAATDHPDALTDPAPAAYFMGFGDSSLDFVLHVWASRFEQALALQSAVRRAVHRTLGEAGIEIPFPQRDLNLKSVTPAAAKSLRGETRPDSGGAAPTPAEPV